MTDRAGRRQAEGATPDIHWALTGPPFATVPQPILIAVEPAPGDRGAITPAQGTVTVALTDQAHRVAFEGVCGQRMFLKSSIGHVWPLHLEPALAAPLKPGGEFIIARGPDPLHLREVARSDQMLFLTYPWTGIVVPTERRPYCDAYRKLRRVRLAVGASGRVERLRQVNGDTVSEAIAAAEGLAATAGGEGLASAIRACGESLRDLFREQLPRGVADVTVFHQSYEQLERVLVDYRQGGFLCSEGEPQPDTDA